MKRQSKWLAVIGAGCLMLAVSLAGCGSAGAKAAGAGKGGAPVEITYWSEHTSGALHQAVIHEVAWFNRTHPRIHVNLQFIVTDTQGMAAFESGKAPSVAGVKAYVVPTLAQAGALENLGPYVHGKHGLSATQISQLYYSAVWKDMKENSSIQYMMPQEKKALVVVYYNENLFKKAGISHGPATWGQVSQDAKKISAL
jgi:sn-glycerol 3-phosphate transport system substrate-binding protein